ncbi:PTS transporter subunit EIIC [Serratia sp. AKBS12]|uniref:PTS transporter subunit EIIC n=1 Tax=Serratia sp. AKBS12 TaxID=2974597 RepID=UPI0021652756|nr:PTS transporter subunit EIIC [Serratia sp. AKBS12]MCS3408009.1 PTS transporter subunit EIIC [Serratia sp. AKBS12]HEI8866301.1 PTS transporter subunit EIIC [Serratia odorifera]
MTKFGARLHDFGKGLMMPISVIAAAGIFLGVAAAMQNPAVVGESFSQMAGPQLVIGFIRNIAGALFANLPLFFAVAAAIALAKDEKPTAAFAAVIGFLTMHMGISYSLLSQGITAQTTTPAYLTAHGMGRTEALMYSAEFSATLGIFSYQMSVLGGVIAGLITAFLHNRYYTIVLPTAINFFGGRRFVPIVTVLVMPLVGIALSLIWPTIGAGIAWIGQLIGHSGIYGTFVYAFTERILIPTGLHHILNETVRFTPIGGVSPPFHGESIVGALNIFNTALANPGAFTDRVVRGATRFLAQGKIPVMMFGMPAAALAIYHCARPEHKKRVKALMMAGALASFTTGITEPLEFTFIFVSPLLFVFHAIMSGLSFALMQLFGVMIGNVQGGAIDFLVFGVLGGSQTAWWYPLLLGAIYFPLYYFTFRLVITRMQVKTPGREDDDSAPQAEVVVAPNEQVARIIVGLGGKENIQLVDCCFTRLRVKVVNMEEIDDEALMASGASGIKRASDEDIQVIYGLQVEKIANQLKQALA